MSLKERVIVLTGASSGIGAAIATRLGQEGCHLALGARRELHLADIAADVQAAGGQVVWATTDVTRAADVSNLFAKARDHFGHVDAIINNAGVMPLSYIKNGRIDEWDRMIDVNIKGVLYGIAAALPHFRERRSGHVINIGSNAGRRLYKGTAVYSATKFAVRAITEGLRLELDPKDRIKATLIALGAVRTDLHMSIADKEYLETSEFNVETLLEPEDIAAAVVYALSQAHRVNVDELQILPRDQTF